MSCPPGRAQDPHISLCLPGHIQVFLLLLGALPFCLSPSQLPLLQFLLDAYTCIRVCFSSCNRKTFVLFYCLFPFAEGMRMAVFRDCLVRGTWWMARSVELTGWLQGSSGKEPEWHQTARFPDS